MKYSNLSKEIEARRGAGHTGKRGRRLKDC